MNDFCDGGFIAQRGDSMEQPYIALLRSFPGDAPAMLAAAGLTNVWENPDPRKLSADQIVEHAHGAAGVMIAPGDGQFGSEFFDAVGDQLRVISCYAVGYDSVNVAEATARGIAVGYTPGPTTEPTADITWLLLLGAARNAASGERLVRSGTWQGISPSDRPGCRVVGKTLLIVGAGRIGRAVARRAIGWQMKLLYNSRSAKPEMEAPPLSARHVELDAGLAEADFVSIHTPLTEHTRYLFDAKRLAKIKRGAILINTARGAIIEEAALVDALTSGHLAAAGLDVYEQEPLIHPGLMELDNTFLLPHVGSATREDRIWMTEMAVANLAAGVRREALPHRAI